LLITWSLHVYTHFKIALNLVELATFRVDESQPLVLDTVVLLLVNTSKIVSVFSQGVLFQLPLVFDTDRDELLFHLVPSHAPWFKEQVLLPGGR